MLVSIKIYKQILNNFPDAITSAVNFFLVLEDIRPTFQYDYRRCIADCSPLNLALELSSGRLTIITNNEEPVIILKKNIDKITKCKTMG
jgi:hypothetical protein